MDLVHSPSSEEEAEQSVEDIELSVSPSSYKIKEDDEAIPVEEQQSKQLEDLVHSKNGEL